MDFTLKNRINEALAKAIRERWSYSKLRAEISSLLNLYYTKSAIKNTILRELIKGSEYKWLLKHNLDSEQKAKLNDIFINEKYGMIDNYAKQKAGINLDIKKVFELALNRDTTIDGITDELNSLNMKYKHWSNTIVRTAQSAVSSLQFQIKSEEAGIDKFLYTGPSPERPLCKSLYGNIYTTKQIENLSNRLGYDVMIYRGLWNCKHRWEAVVSENTSQTSKNTDTGQTASNAKIQLNNKTVDEADFNYEADKAIKRYGINEDYDDMDNIYENYTKTNKYKDTMDYKNSLDKNTLNAIKGYETSDYIEINEALRVGKTPNAYKNIKDGDFSYKIAEDTALYRGERFYTQDGIEMFENRLKEISNGDGIKQLISTSYSNGIAKKFSAVYDADYNSIIYKINCKKGNKVCVGLEYEQEIILDKNTPYTIKSIERIETKNKKTTLAIIEMEI